MSTFSVIRSGPLTTIQDGGRSGQHQLGLTEGGAMDFRSFALANRLVGNDIHSAALEISLGGLTLKCLKTAQICLTGAYCPLAINGKSVQLWQAHAVAPNDIIEVGYAALGVRSYLSCSGGFISPQWFGSQATVIREGLGEALKNGDQLDSHPSLTPLYKIHFSDQPSLRNSACLRFVPGYQWAHLATDQQQAFLSTEYAISPANDRMGYQLAGTAIDTGIETLYSEGISLGAIQITGNGQPIVLTNDRQTIGGYPKLGSVISEDLDKLAQLNSHATVTFKTIDPEAAVKLFRQYRSRIEGIALLER